MRVAAIIFFSALLAACAQPPQQQRPTAEAPVEMVAHSMQVAHSPLRPYPNLDEFLQCVPFARQVSGIEIYGDAWTWWDKAQGHYDRGNRPEVGAVLALERTSRMRYGHVGVVAAIQDSRRILVTHANWGGDSSTRGKVHARQPVVDVSPNNDWSEVRLMNTQGTFGAVYPAHGFIYQRPTLADARGQR
ncbi:CHAP domain-containing protein [Oceanibaculum pacificum]|uniref:Peptidase C51 domain-containing protein n=1 Tax=Oceanibaculum pacificum TaxID=580166 RepID=A0A154WBZ2_9PROT|nr:CHAP domain-containing protein [Oceanibaculum pacificum]KZD11010.1 hypothetical protein AUP43_05865 [Oceanibaculum pacificum]